MTPPRGDRGQAPRYFTTHQVATWLGVSLATIANWERQGRLRAQRTPGGHRRIALGELLRFCRDNDYPTPPELEAFQAAAGTSPPRVLVLHGQPDLAELLRDYLLLDADLEVRVAEGPLQAGFTLAAWRPDLVVLDLDQAEVSPAELRDLAWGAAGPPVVVGLTSLRDDRRERMVADAGVVEVVEAGADLTSVVTQLRRHLPRR